MKIKFKSLFATLALGSLLSVNAFAQEDEAVSSDGGSSSGGGAGIELKYGIEVGGTWSSFARNWDSFTDKQAGYAVGVFAQSSIMGPLGASVEFLYSQQGAADVNPWYYYPAALVQSGDLVTQDVDIKTHKLALPILLNFSPTDMPGAGDVKPVAYAGVEIDYLISASVRDYQYINDTYDLVLGNSQAYPFTYNFNRWDYAYVVGTGITFEGEDRGYGIDVKYKMGFSNINRSAFNYISNDYNQNSLLVSLKIGL